jgi:hypothetical protein
MTKLNVVTAFNENSLNDHASQMFQRVEKYWHPDIKLSAYHFECKLDAYKLPSIITYKNLEDIEEFNDFRTTMDVHDGTENGTLEYNWRIDALLSAPKVFALTEEAFSIAEKTKDGGWLVWMNTNVIPTATLTPDFVNEFFPEGADIVHLSGDQVDKNPDQYSDPSLIAFNLNHKAPLDILGDLRGAYISGELLSYREWHDAFILERLLNIYRAHGMRVHSLTPSNTKKGIQSTPLSGHLINIEETNRSIRDTDGNRIFPLSKEALPPDIRPNRTKMLADIIRFYKPKSIVETGTWNGGRAIEMSLAAFENTDELNYTGYDLFEDATDLIDEEEFNLKPHVTRDAVRKRLTEFKNKMKEEKKSFNFKLVKGNTRDVLEKENPDFALIGGGNSIITIHNDYEKLKDARVKVIDNYFSEDSDKKMPSKKYHGANVLIQNLENIKRVVLPSSDPVKNGGVTHFALVFDERIVPPLPDELLNVPIVVHPRDCVDKEYIQANIKENMTLIDKNKFLGKCIPNDHEAIVVSGGHSTDFTKLKELIRNNPEAKVLCVKHSYPTLLKNGIKPWGCVVLDPRSIEGESTHGVIRKDLFKTIDPSTKFFVASMTDPSVTKYLIEKKANIYGWHAFTESLRSESERETEIKDQKITVMQELGIPEGATLITGGTCAAMRCLGIMHTMGFRKFDLFGFDSSIKDEPTAEQRKETTGAEDEEARPKYLQVNVRGENFWTTGELLAMAQDCERVFNDTSMSLSLSVHGEHTLVSSLWQLYLDERKVPEFKDVFND